MVEIKQCQNGNMSHGFTGKIIVLRSGEYTLHISGSESTKEMRKSEIVKMNKNCSETKHNHKNHVEKEKK